MVYRPTWYWHRVLAIRWSINTLVTDHKNPDLK